MTKKVKKLVPVGHRIIVKQDPVELKTASGLILAVDEKAHKYIKNTGTVVAVGPDAWKAFRQLDDNGVLRNGKPWCKVGDRIVYSKNAGKYVPDPETGEELVVMNDEDVVTKIEEVEVENDG